HKGLQMTASHLSEQNFWGGNSYLGPEQGYQRVDERVGSMRHDGFEEFTVTDDRLRFAENLTWVAHPSEQHSGGQEWAKELRTVEVHSVEPAEGTWAMDEGAVHASHWFVRSEPIPSVAFSWAFFEEFALPPGESFAYRYRVVIADGAWDRDRAETYLKSHGW
ncbi:DUF6807 family protein, partial [Streptomyces sp. MCAF7]